MSFEAYSVGVKLSLMGNLAPSLIGLIGHFSALDKKVLTTQKSVSELDKSIARLGKSALVGGALLGVGAFGFGVLGAPLDEARKYELAFTKFKTLNLGAEVNKQADQFARGASLMGISSRELMNTMSESVGLFGSFDAARKLAPIISQLNAANSAIFGGKISHIDEGGTRALMKFIDRRGGTRDEASFMRNLNLAQRMVTGSGGFVKFRDLDQFSSMGGTAFRGLSDQGVLNMALLLQEQGGAKAGTSLMSVYQNLVAGRTPKKTMALLQEFGLGTLAMETHAIVGGKPMKSLVMTKIKDADLLQSNPTAWFRSVFLSALAAKGITSERGILKATNDLLSNRNASNQASIITTQGLQLLRDSNLAKNAMDANQTIAAYRNDPNSKFADMQAKYNSLLVELGLIVLPTAIKGIQSLTSILKSAADFSRSFPAFTKALVYTFGIMSAAAAAGGAIILFKTGISALTLALGVGSAAGGVGLGAAIAGLLAPVAMAIAGITVLAGLIGLLAPDDKSKPAPGHHWVPGTGRQGSGGHWESDTVRPNSPGRGNAPGHVFMDGRKVGQIVSDHQGREMGRPSVSGRYHDVSMSPAKIITGGSH